MRLYQAGYQLLWRRVASLRLGPVFAGTSRAFLLGMYLAGASAACGQPQTGIEHVIHISVDGLRADLLQELVTVEPQLLPNFWRLQHEGAATYNARTDYTHTLTIPNHGSILTGRPVSQPEGMANTVHHGYTSNFPRATDTLHNAGNPDLNYIHSVFDVVHDNGRSTGFFVTKNRLAIYGRSYDEAHGGPDAIGEDNGTAKIDVSVIHDQDAPLMLQDLAGRMATDPLNYAFLHITDPDTAGHDSGWLSPAWGEAVADVDQYVGQIFEMVEQSATLQGSTAVILTADHGGGAPATNHTDASAPENYTIPIFVWGTSLTPGSDLYEHFSNRVDPREARPTYAAADQPLRNGDTANMALALLGFEPIPGSLMRPTFVGSGWNTLDFNDDGALNVADLDALMTAMALTPSDTAFDLDGDSLVDPADLQEWLAGAARENGFEASYAVGDTNLDGQVSNDDMTVVLANLFTSQPNWSLGNFNADGVIDGVDFHVVFANRSVPAATMAVPEPSSNCLLFVCVGVGGVLGRRRSRRAMNVADHPARKSASLDSP